MKKVNEWIKGFRTILIAMVGYAFMFVDVFFTHLLGLSEEALKGAAAMALLVTLKQIKTDVIPKLKGKLSK